MHFPGSDSNKFCKFREFWRTLRKCQNFILFLRSGAVSIFLSKIETSPNCFKFHIHVPGGDSNKFCKFHEFRRTLRKCQNFILFLRSGAVSIFLSNIETSPNCFKFHMHVSGGDSNRFCKFHEFWRPLRKCQNFILFLRSGAVGIFTCVALVKAGLVVGPLRPSSCPSVRPSVCPSVHPSVRPSVRNTLGVPSLCNL